MKKIYIPYLLFIAIALSSFSRQVIVFNVDDQVRTVQCYPNPATSYINFEFPANFDKNVYSIAVYSFMGKKMSELSVNSTKLVLTLETYTRGLYVYHLKDKNGQIIESGKFQVVK